MPTALAVVGLLALIVTLASALFAIWTARASADQFLELTKALLSWQVIAGGLAVVAGSTFHTEIKNILTKHGT